MSKPSPIVVAAIQARLEAGEISLCLIAESGGAPVKFHFILQNPALALALCSQVESAVHQVKRIESESDAGRAEPEGNAS